MKKLLLFFAVFACLAVMSSTVIAPSNFYVVEGYVYDVETGLGINGAQVDVLCVENGNTAGVGAGNDGAYWVKIDCPIGYNVIVTATKNNVGSGTNESVMVTYETWMPLVGPWVPVGIAQINVPIPEFPITAIPALLSILSFGLIRKKLI